MTDPKMKKAAADADAVLQKIAGWPSPHTATEERVAAIVRKAAG